MINSLKEIGLQYRIKALENLLLLIEEKNGNLEQLTQDLNSPSKNTRWNAKYSLLSRGIGAEQFISDEDQVIRNKAEEILELRKSDIPGVTAYLNEIDFHLNTKEYSQIVDITHSMFPQQDGGING